MSEQYLQRRLAWASRATELPASVQFDLALDENFDDDSLDEVAGHFGANQDSGWGLSEVFDSLMSREPQRQEVEDLTAYQQSLIDQGYAPAGTTATGTWDPFWNGAARRAERDAYSARIGGETPVSTPFASAFQFLGNVMPSKVFQGIVGMAKGLVEQAPETIARGGLVGGAATGAAIGAVAGGPVGALVGGALGGIGGFFGDLLTEQEGEEDQSGLQVLWDALTPYQEYTGRQGAQQFFEDLGFVASAAAMVSGAKMAVGGAQAGLAAGAERGLLTQAATSQPGLLARGLTGTKGSAAIGAAAGGVGIFTETHDLSDALKGALAGGVGGYGLAKFVPGFGQGVARLSATQGFGAQASRPLIQTINGAFSGVSRAQLTGRMAGALGDDSKIEEEIQAQDAHHSGVRDIIDNTLGWIINPNGFFAFEGAKVADGFGKLLGSEANLAYDLLATERIATGKTGLLEQQFQTLGAPARQEAWMTQLSPKSVAAGKGVDLFEVRKNDFRLRLSYGLQQRAHEEVRTLGRIDDPLERQEAFAKVIAREKRDWLEEKRAFDAGETTEAPITEDAMSWSFGIAGDKDRGPTAYYAWLADMQGRGSGLDRMGGQVTAEDIAEDLTLAVREGTLATSFADDVPVIGEGNVLTKADVRVKGTKPASKTTDLRADQLRNQAKLLTKEIRKDEDALLNAPDPVAAAEAINVKKLEVKRLRKEAKSIPTIDARQEVTFTVANLDDSSRGLMGTPTVQLAERLSARVSELTDTITSSQREFQKALGKGEQHAIAGLRDQFGKARDELHSLMTELQNRGMVEHKQWEKATAILKEAETKSGVVQKRAVFDQIAERLERSKKIYGNEVDLPPEITARLPEGKTIIATGEDMIFSKDIIPGMVAKNIDLYAEAPAFFASLRHSPFSKRTVKAGARGLQRAVKYAGLSGTLHSNQSVFYARAANQASEVHQVLVEAGVELQGQAFMKLLRKGMDDLNHGNGVVHQGTELHASAMGPVVRRVRTVGDEKKAEIGMYLADVRELSAAQIQEYGHLDDLVPEGVDPTELAGRIYHALKKGAVLGADTAQMSLLHPMSALRMVSKSLQIDGLPGAVEYMRTFHLENPAKTGAIGGAVVGGEIEREKGGGLGEVVKGAVIGGVTGGVAGRAISKEGFRNVTFNTLLKTKFKKDSYGYLPDHLHRLSMAARYTFSFAFDIGRHWEQAVIGLAREDIPMGLGTKRAVIKDLEERYGPGAYQEARDLHDSMRRGIEMQQIEEADRRLFQAGIAGYSPRYAEMRSAYLIKRNNPGISLKELEARVTMLEGYGIGRRNIEKSVNFVFFPFSFSKKLLTTLGDFALQEPGRALMIHEGYRRMFALDEDYKNGDEDSFGAQFGEWLKKNLPFAEQLGRLNNLAYGIGPGRFWGQGLKDHPEDLGTAFQVLASAFVPSGANTPIAQMFGGLGDAAVHLFSPVVITEDPGAPTRGRELAWKEVYETIDSFVPAIRDVTNFVSSIDRQAKATLGGGDPFWQAQHYNDDRKAAELEIAPMAQALGYSSVQGFLASDAGAAVKAVYDQRELERQAEFPLGYEQNQSFVNNDGLNEKALADLSRKDDKSPAEEQILSIRAMEYQLEQMAPIVGMGVEEMKLTYQPQIREQAAAFADNREFIMLWDRFFASTFGPIAKAVA